MASLHGAVVKLSCSRCVHSPQSGAAFACVWRGLCGGWIFREKAQAAVLDAAGGCQAGGTQPALAALAALPAPSPAPACSLCLPTASGSHGNADSFGKFMLLILPPMPMSGSTLK